jgi:hypothetical protein
MGVSDADIKLSVSGGDTSAIDRVSASLLKLDEDRIKSLEEVSAAQERAASKEGALRAATVAYSKEITALELAGTAQTVAGLEQISAANDKLVQATAARAAALSDVVRATEEVRRISLEKNSAEEAMIRAQTRGDRERRPPQQRLPKKRHY